MVMKQVILPLKKLNDLVLTWCWPLHTQPDNLWFLFNQEKNAVNESVLSVLFYCPSENRNGSIKTNPSTIAPVNPVPSLQWTQYWSTADGFSQGVKIEWVYSGERKNAGLQWLSTQGFLKPEMLTDAFKSVGIELVPRPVEN